MLKHFSFKFQSGHSDVHQGHLLSDSLLKIVMECNNSANTSVHSNATFYTSSMFEICTFLLCARNVLLHHLSFCFKRAPIRPILTQVASIMKSKAGITEALQNKD